MYRLESELPSPDADYLPDLIKHFASAVYCDPEFWSDKEKIREELLCEGNKD